MGCDRKRAAQLQINNSGAWKTVARLDAAEDGAMHYARQAAARLALVDPKGAGRWRIATCDPLPIVLETYSAAHGWASDIDTLRRPNAGRDAE